MIRTIWWIAAVVAFVGLWVMADYAVPMFLAGAELRLRNELMMGAGTAFIYSAPGWLLLIVLGLRASDLPPLLRRFGLVLGCAPIALYVAALITDSLLGQHR